MSDTGFWIVEIGRSRNKQWHRTCGTG